MKRSCPLCREIPDDGLDFHHWSYRPEVGVEICRDCHDEIHLHGDATPTNDRRWFKDALKRLVELHETYHGEARSAGELIDRYNVPDDIGICVQFHFSPAGC